VRGKNKKERGERGGQRRVGRWRSRGRAEGYKGAAKKLRKVENEELGKERNIRKLQAGKAEEKTHCRWPTTTSTPSNFRSSRHNE
jgi:hypothetical protein